MNLLLRAALAVAVVTLALPVAAKAQSGFDRAGHDYARFNVPAGDPAVCAARCDRDPRCRAWAFAYPRPGSVGGSNVAVCWLKNRVPPATKNPCCTSGVKGADLLEQRSGPVEAATDRFGGDYRSFELASDPTGAACQRACESEDRCRAWTYVRPGYVGPSARCYLKDRITRPRRKPGALSGVVR